MVFFIWSITTAFSSAYSAKALDDWMDKGSIFDFIRFWVATVFDPDFRSKVAAFDSYSYFERQEEYRQAYWELAARKKRFTAWVCVDCISVRLALLFLICTGFYLNAVNGLDLVFIPYSIFVLALNRFFVGLKIS